MREIDMTLLELFILAVGLSMDAFAVAICKGLAMRPFTLRKAAIVGLYFGVFQAGMPLMGYLLGTQFKDQIMAIDHWVAFGLLTLIGLNMIRESRQQPSDVQDACPGDTLAFRRMIVLALATSIDALAVGITLAFLRVSILPAVGFIGVITFTLSILGVKIGNVFGDRFESRAELAGGIILIGMGINILLEHLQILPI